MCHFTLPDSIALMSQRWDNTYTTIDTYYNDTNKVTTTIYPVGYLQLSTDKSYNVLSDNVPLSGPWAINTNCQLVLDSGKEIQRNFDILSVHKDSLTIRRKAGNVVYTQHYKYFSCSAAITSLIRRWDNTYTKIDYFGDNTYTGVPYTDIKYPIGYFQINPDNSYNVVSDGDVRQGQWSVNKYGCKLVLDKDTQIERAFEVLRVHGTDSLTIWRRDTSIHAVFTQHYIKH